MTVAVVLLLVAASILLAWLAYEVVRLRAKVDAVPNEGGVFESLRRLDEDLAEVEDLLGELQPRFVAVEDALPQGLRRTAVVNYDAYGEVAGQLSRSIALLNDYGDGLVISVLVSREGTLWYTKEIRGGHGSEHLSPEEEQAVARALGGTMPR